MQTTYTTNMSVARRGQIADISRARLLMSRIAESDLTFGNVVQQGSVEQQALAIAALPSADTDAIATALASAASAQTFVASDFDGAIGAGRITPAQQLTLAFNSHADWLATTAKVVGEGPGGQEVVEDISIPAGGNVTLRTGAAFSRVSYIDLPAQGGTNGTIEVGTDPVRCALSPVDYPGIAGYDPVREPHLSTAEVAQYKTFTVVKRGFVWAQVEAAVSIGDPLYVRMVESGADLRGQVRGSYASGFFPYHNAHFVTAQASADGLALVELGG